MQKIIGVKRNGDKNTYYFLAGEDCVVGSKVVATFDEFQTIGTVSRVDVKIDADKAAELSKITRIANETDLSKYNALREKALSQMPKIKTKSLELGLMMKFVSVDYSLDGSKVMIVFSSEDRVDFRQFLKELATMLKSRIELKQIGQRDEVKVCGGVGPCGQPCCCARFLDDFEHVTVKMAKVQGLSLSPTKINGICGRLMCCLGYEADTYEEILSHMPKMGSEVTCPNGVGKVVYNDILRERVSMKRQAEGDTFVVEDFDIEEISVNGKFFKRTIDKPEVKKEAKTKPEKETFLNDLKPVEAKVEEKQEKSEKLEKSDKSKNKHKNRHQNKNQANEQKKDVQGLEIVELGEKKEKPAGFHKHRRRFKPKKRQESK